MIAITVLGVSEGFAAMPQGELLKGAVAGAFIAAIAFLAGYAAIRRSGVAVCALLMVTGAAALQFSGLGFFAGLPSEATVMFQALFAASAIVFLSATIGAARFNPLLSGVMFTAALVVGGMGVINFFDRVDLAPLMQWALIGVGAFAVILAALQSFRGDAGARLVLPGVALAGGAALLGVFGAQSAVMSIASQGLFTLGVLAASLVALTEGGIGQAVSHAASHGGGDRFGFRNSMSGHERRSELRAAREREEIVLDSQIAKVLDYSGVGVWDWSPDTADQTDGLGSLLGADSNAPFTPDAMRNFVHADDAKRFDAEVLAPEDGHFDVSIKLFDGRVVRMRGARAANDETGEIERLVAFVENAVVGEPASGSSTGSSKGGRANGVNEQSVRAATEAAIVPGSAGAMSGKLVAALENGDIIAAFQPVVSLDNKKIAGYEALARWRDQEDGAEEGPDRFVRAAERAGQGGALAKTMLDQAAAFLSDALKKEKRKDLFVTMNVSWGQIRQEGFLEAVRDAVSKYDLPKNALVLELTEADAVTDTTLAGEVFGKLKASGVALAFDDFGAGFTCLSNLRKYDFDYLKIDKSFADDIEAGGDGLKIVSALASLGKDLGLKVIVEGLESNAAAKKAHQTGCAFGQGYAFGKPVILDAALAPTTETDEADEAALSADESRPVKKKLFGGGEHKSAKADAKKDKKRAPLLEAKDDAELQSAEAPNDDEAHELTADGAASQPEDAVASGASSKHTDAADLSDVAHRDGEAEKSKSFERKIEVDFGGEDQPKGRRWRLWGGSQGLR